MRQLRSLTIHDFRLGLKIILGLFIMNFLLQIVAKATPIKEDWSILGPFQTTLHSCAEPNSVRFDLGATLERQLIQTAYLCRT